MTSEIDREAARPWLHQYLNGSDIHALAEAFAAHRRAAVAELVEALAEADAAIKEWFRYLHGGEMRGSYDGKPEREMLRKAGYRTSAALSRHQEGLGKGDGERAI